MSVMIISSRGGGGICCNCVCNKLCLLIGRVSGGHTRSYQYVLHITLFLHHGGSPRASRCCRCFRASDLLTAAVCGLLFFASLPSCPRRPAPGFVRILPPPSVSILFITFCCSCDVRKIGGGPACSVSPPAPWRRDTTARDCLSCCSRERWRRPCLGCLRIIVNPPGPPPT